MLRLVLVTAGLFAGLARAAWPQEHWKLAGVRVRHKGGERLFDVSTGTAAPINGHGRLDGGAYTPDRGYGWDRLLRRQERSRKDGKGLIQSLITAPARPVEFHIAGPKGVWRKGQRLSLNVAIGPGDPPSPGNHWG